MSSKRRQARYKLAACPQSGMNLWVIDNDNVLNVIRLKESVNDLIHYGIEQIEKGVD